MQASNAKNAGSTTAVRYDWIYRVRGHWGWLMEQTSAIYEPMIPMGWIGAEPADRHLAWEPGTVVPSDWCDVVISRRLRCGLAVSAQRRGFTVYDFAGWPPGVPHPAARSSRQQVWTWGESSRAEKPAVVQRLRVINTHLTLLHVASLVCDEQSATVVRVIERDLFRFDYPDDRGEGSWYQPFGNGLPRAVSVQDRNRFGVLSVTAFEYALDLLDLVIEAGALVSFDLINQAQTAVSTHDYALAVVAGWTVCELSVRGMGGGLPGISAASAAEQVCKALEQAGRLPTTLLERLHVVRRRRNAWLHSGIEPAETDALEALQVASELLRETVPDLTIRPTSSLLIL